MALPEVRQKLKLFLTKLTLPLAFLPITFAASCISGWVLGSTFRVRTYTIPNN